METSFIPTILYLVGVSIAAFAAIDIDKRQARRSGFRVPELALLLLAAAGGTLGTYLGCVMFRHKVHKRGFTVALHLVLVVQVLIVLMIFAQT